MMKTRPRRLCLISLAILAGTGGVVSCGNSTSEPEENCDGLVGLLFIELVPPPSGTFSDYEVRVGDSIQLRPVVHRVDAARRTFNPQQGWYCVTSASSPATGVVTLTTNDVALVRLNPNGWVRGLSRGFAVVFAASPAAPATVWIGVEVLE